MTENTKQTKSDLAEIARLSKEYVNWIKTENKKTIKEFNVYAVGKPDPKRHLLEKIQDIQERSIFQNFGFMINAKAF